MVDTHDGKRYRKRCEDRTCGRYSLGDDECPIDRQRVCKQSGPLAQLHEAMGAAAVEKSVMRERVKELSEALQDMLDFAGPPLIRHAARYSEAAARARKLLRDFNQ